MLHPLVSLWRHAGRVTFYDTAGMEEGASLGFAPGGAGQMPLAVRRRFRAVEEAQQYLRYWAGDPSARAELRWLVARCGAGSVAQGRAADAWLQPLAVALVQGHVVLLEETARRAMPGRLSAPAGAAAAAPAALAALPALSSLPQTPAVPNLLPALEEIRIEGAEVLPELDQTMAQVAASLESVQGAGASLQPAPDKVGEIQGAMTGAAADATQALDGA